jgi:archaellum component FlaD/FlaE
MSAPQEAITREEFEKERKGHLEEIPEEFHIMVSEFAHERGGSESMETELNYYSEMVSQLRGPIAVYTKRIRQESKQK